MGTPEAFYVVSQRGEAEPRMTDLMQYLEPIEWSGVETKAAAFLARPPRSVTRSLGDYTFVLRPAPYYEEQEDKYIQQITKTVVNVGGLPGAWDAAARLAGRDRAARQAVCELGRRRVSRRRARRRQAGAARRGRGRVPEPRAADRRAPLRPAGQGHGAAGLLQDAEHSRERGRRDHDRPAEGRLVGHLRARSRRRRAARGQGALRRRRAVDQSDAT